MEVIFKSLIPESSLNIITPIILILIGIYVETKYTTRVSMFTNAISLYIFYHSVTMSTPLGYVVNLAIIFGVIGGIAYITRTPLPPIFYRIPGLNLSLVSSIVTGLLIFYGLSL